jgi:hypothetical protein
MPADHARCIAADVTAKTTTAPLAPGVITPALPLLPARATVAAQKVNPGRAMPAAKRGSLLGAIVDAIGNDQDANKRRMQAVEDQNIRNMEAQFRPQFEHMLYVELAFLRRVCKPEANSFAAVARAAKADVQGPVHEYVVSQYTARRGPAGGSNAADPRSEIQQRLVPLVKDKFGPEKAQIYRQECDKRAEARKHAVVMNVIAAVDERLILTTAQRAKLVQSLSVNYENSWDQNAMMFAFNNQNFVPSIRDESIVPLLDEQQKGVWKDTVKQNRQVFFGQVFQNALGGDATEIQEIARIAVEVKDGR